MKPPPDRKKAPAHASNTEPGKNQKHGNPTQSTTKRQPQFRFGQVTAGEEIAITFHKDLLVVDHARLAGMSRNELVELAKETNGKAVKAAKQTLLHAGQTGFILIVLKEKLAHGQFMKEVEILTGIGHRTATTYMMIARNYGSVSNLRGVRDAIRFIRDAATETKESQKWQSIPPPAQRPPAAPVVIEAELVEPPPAPVTCPAPQDDEPDTVVVDGTRFDIDDEPVDPSEPLLIAIKAGMPEAEPEPIYHAVDRLIFVLIDHNCSAEYIRALADSVNLTLAKKS